jgi:nucleotide-binding universal stress UspA family protein
MSIHPLDLPPISYSNYPRPATTRPRTVILGYDGSTASRAAAVRAAELAGAGGCVVAVCAVNRVPTGMEFAGLDDGDFGRARLEKRVVHSPPASAIAELANERGASHIVLGWDATAPGRVCTALMDTASCPVVVVPPKRD